MNRSGSPVVMTDEDQDGLLQVWQGVKVIGLQHLALQDTEPELDLIEPGRVLGQPVDLHLKRPGTSFCLGLQPGFQSFRRVRGPVIQNQGQGVHPTLPGRRDDRVQQKRLEVDKPFPGPTLAVHLPVGDTQPGEELQSALPLVARREPLPRPPPAWGDTRPGGPEPRSSHPRIPPNSPL